MNENISYQPHVLRTLNEITAYFKVGKETVYNWIDHGAPICVEERNGLYRYSCEAAMLQAWRLEQSRKRE